MSLIAVLEDDSRRIAAIRAAAASLLADCEIKLFSDAREMERWLVSNLSRLQLLSLDCDLDSMAITGDDVGTGETITAFLVSHLPRCPVIIHSSNALRAPAMHMELATAGCARVLLRPFHDGEQWANDVRKALSAIR
jgi:hypothetical protein